MSCKHILDPNKLMVIESLTADCKSPLCLTEYFNDRLEIR